MKEAINNINFDFYDDKSGAIRDGMVQPTQDLKYRRKHYYRGMEPEEYHIYLDNVYNKHLDDNDNDWIPKKLQKTKLSEIVNKELQKKNEYRSMWDNFTINSNTFRYKVWTSARLIICLISLIYYPYFTVNGFPTLKRDTSWFWVVVFTEVVFFVDILMNFFV